MTWFQKAWAFCKKWGREIGLFVLALAGLSAWLTARARKAQLEEIRAKEHVRVTRERVANTKHERSVIVAALGQDHLAVKRIDEQLADNQTKLTEVYKTEGLTPEEIDAEFKRLGY